MTSRTAALREAVGPIDQHHPGGLMAIHEAMTSDGEIGSAMEGEQARLDEMDRPDAGPATIFEADPGCDDDEPADGGEADREGTDGPPLANSASGIVEHHAIEPSGRAGPAPRPDVDHSGSRSAG